MDSFVALIAVIGGAAVVHRLAARLRIPYPTLLALAGMLVAASPLSVPIDLKPDLVLAVLVAPVLTDAAGDVSLQELRAYWVVITCLVIVAVGLTTSAVAFATHLLEPSVPWAAAVALGAIVAPPDAAAATSILRPLDAPRRINAALEGESLLNDASSLLIYRIAIGSMGAGWSAAAPWLPLSIIASLVLGPVVAVANIRLLRRLGDVQVAIILQFVGTFGLWIVADRLGLSAVLTIVSYALVSGYLSPRHIPARLRLTSQAVWKTVVLALNAFAFVFVGLELRPILAAAPASEVAGWIRFSILILVTVIIVRIGWAMLYNTFVRSNWIRPGLLLPLGTTATWQGGVIISWCGMRGVVTLAGALALPENFPHRPLLVFTAFVVTAGTLIIQGLTLGPLVRALDAHDAVSAEHELAMARLELDLAAQAATTVSLAAVTEGSAHNSNPDADLAPTPLAKSFPGPADRIVLQHRRAKLISMRHSREIRDHVFHMLEEELDHLELLIGRLAERLDDSERLATASGRPDTEASSRG